MLVISTAIYRLSLLPATSLGYVLSHSALPPFGYYQIILLGDRGTLTGVNDLPKVSAQQ